MRVRRLKEKNDGIEAPPFPFLELLLRVDAIATMKTLARALDCLVDGLGVEDQLGSALVELHTELFGYLSSSDHSPSSTDHLAHARHLYLQFCGETLSCNSHVPLLPWNLVKALIEHTLYS